MNMSKYVNVKYALTDYANLVKFEEFQELSKNPPDNTPMYYSLFYYNDEQFKEFQKTRSLKGITNVKTDNLVFDFDSPDMEQAKKDTATLVSRLKESGYTKDNFKIYSSANKGFHVHLKLDQELNPTQVKILATEHFGKGLESLDLKVYDPQRIFRVPNSLNEKSGLFKNQLTEAQLRLPVNVIKNDVCKVKKAQDHSMVPIKFDQSIVNVKERVKTVTKTTSKMTERPKHWLEYKWELLNATGLKAGERDESMMILAATCRGLGYNREITESFLNYFDQRYSTITEQDANETQVQEKLDSVFQEGWQGGTYTYKNNPWLKEYCKRIGVKVSQGKEDRIIRIGEVSEGFSEYIKNIEQNTIKTGIRVLDEEMPLTVGMNLGILGAPSSGKTALALSILKHTSKMGNVSVMASLDMHRNRLFEKLLLKESNFSRKELYAAYKSGKVDSVIDQIKKDYSNVWFYDRSSPTIDDIRSYVERVQEETGKKVKLVMIDYFERVGAEKSDDTAASKEVSGKIQDMLNDLDVCVVTLVQPNKMSMGGGPDTPLLSYNNIKGSSFLAQSFRSIVSIWRPFFNPQTKDQDKFMSMAILKNDLGEVGQFDFNWNGKAGAITEMSEEDENTLKLWLDEKNNKKSNEGWGEQI